ncbi:MAG TPA: hypothetical protein VJN94_04445 [Candidatus Binataceae bacterium]|nr:hypothetical protein [Candidatus Binataceae bacterium]
MAKNTDHNLLGRNAFDIGPASYLGLPPTCLIGRSLLVNETKVSEFFGRLKSNFFRHHGVALTVCGLILTLVVGLPGLFSRVSIAVDTKFLEPWEFLPSGDPAWMSVPKRFILKNEGPLSLNDVEAICDLEQVEYPNHVSLSNFGFVGPQRQQLGTLGPSDTSTVECKSVEEYVFSQSPPMKAWIGVTVTFRANWSPFHSQHTQTFLCGGPCPTDTCCPAPMFAPSPK